MKERLISPSRFSHPTGGGTWFARRQLYADAGIPEYWTFDYLNETATLLELRGGEYVERATLGPPDTLTTPLLPGLAIPLADIFRNRRAMR